MSEIMPAILTASVEDLRKKISQAKPYVGWAQIDIADGAFVNNKTIAVKDIPAGLPKMQLEAHLMVIDPAAELSACKAAGIKRAIVHVETVADPEKILDAMERLGLQTGVAINPETPVKQLTPYGKRVSLILLMSVHPGFQAQSFIPATLGRIKQARSLAPDALIEVDGGVKRDNIGSIARAGADIAAVGSALYANDAFKENYEALVASMTI
ncbi:MAG: ribulose-phosphate 3-epimerase [Patescibacteria group bacterium]